MRTTLIVVGLLLVASASAHADPDPEYCNCYSYIYVSQASGGYYVYSLSEFVDPYGECDISCYNTLSATVDVELDEDGNLIWSDEETDNRFYGLAEALFEGDVFLNTNYSEYSYHEID